MATTKVSALASKGTLGGSEEILINDGGTSKKSTVTAVRTGITDATKLPLAGGQMTGNITMSGSQTVDGRDVSADGTQLDTNTSAIATKAPIASPTFTGTVAIPNIGNLEAAVAANTAKTGITTSQANAITANTAKVTNATHTGDVTGATALTIADDAVTAAKLANSINTDIATGVTANTTANAALPKTGGTMTGNVTHSSGYLDMAGNTVYVNDSGSFRAGTTEDLKMYHNGTHSFIQDSGTGQLKLLSNGAGVDIQKDETETMAKFIVDGAVKLYHNNVEKFETTANGVTVTGNAVGTMTTDNDGSFSMSASNNFKCTPTGNFTLTFTNIVAQSGNILLVNSGGHTVAAHANTKVDANLLATVSTAGTYLLSHFSDGTNVYMTNSAIYT
jgi:hypothetical protein